MQRRMVLASLAASVSGLGLAGCLANPVADADGPDTTSSPSADPRTGPTIPDDEAKAQAYEAEEELVSEVIENAPCVTGGFGTGYPYSEFTSIEDRTEDGVYVDVELPYWYETGDVHAHTGTQATYLVTGGEVERLEGDDVSDPC